MSIVLGIDIAKATFAAVLQWPDGRRRRKSGRNTPAGFEEFGAWLTRQGAPHVHAGLEATGTYGEALATWLHDAGHVVSVINPAVIHAYARMQLSRTKTDAADAAVIAAYVATQHPPAWTPLAPEVRTVQALVRRLDALQEMRTQEANRRAAGLPAAVQASITTVLATLDAEIAAVRQQLQSHIDQHPGLRTQRDLLTSIPGIGAATAATLLAELFHQRYVSARQAAAFAGVVPRLRQSGTRVARGRLAKLGSSRLRKALFYPALVALRHQAGLAAWHARLRAAGKPKMVIVGAVMRKLVHLAFGVLKSGRPFEPHYAQA